MWTRKATIIDVSANDELIIRTSKGHSIELSIVCEEDGNENTLTLFTRNFALVTEDKQQHELNIGENTLMRIDLVNSNSQKFTDWMQDTPADPCSPNQ